MTETDLYEQIAQYMKLKYPGIPFHFDLSGMWTPSHKARNLYGRVNQRAWPDLYIAKPTAFIPTTDPADLTPDTPIGMPSGNDLRPVYPGLFLELKKEGTRLKKRDGTWANEHVAEQAAMLDILAGQGYIAQFAVGYDEAVQLIDSYLGAAS